MSEPRQWPEQAGASGYPPADPAYSGQYWTPNYYGQTYGGPGYSGQGYGTPMAQPTEQLPAYWQPGSGYRPPPPPESPKSPRWLWIAAAAAVLLVAALVLALVIVSNSTRDATTVAPATPSSAASQPTTPPRVPATRAPSPSATTRPAPTTIGPGTTAPTTPVGPDQTTGPAATDTVVYTVHGEGRAINITYVDTGGVMQTEFNVALPWSKEVSLSAPAKSSASVAVVNVGRDVTCSVSVNGSQVRQRTGRGLTICSGLG